MAPDTARVEADEQRAAVAGRASRFQDYQRRTAEYQGQAGHLARRSALVSNLRGLSFAIAAIGLISAAISTDSSLGLGIGIAAVVGFFVLVALHARVLSAEDLAWRFWRVNENASAR